MADWNVWRREHRDVRPDFSRANLSGANFHDADLIEANLSEANLARATLSVASLHRASLNRADLRGANLAHASLQGANLKEARLGMRDSDGEAFGWLRRIMSAHKDSANLVHANLSEADLRGAVLEGVHLNHANLSEADLRGAVLEGVHLNHANLSGANLSGADLSEATLVRTNLERANLTGCRIYGIAAWDLKLDGASQNGLIITDKDQPSITVSDLEVAQFVYLLLFNPKIRKVIDTVTSKVVLILGRFTEERKAVLDTMREVMQHRDLVPIIFDFDKPGSRDLTETVTTLAHLARFIVADITDPKCIPQELTAIIPDLPSVPVQTVILASEREYTMYERWRRFPWVLPIFRYDNAKHLLASVDESVITPARVMADQLQGRVQKPEPK